MRYSSDKDINVLIKGLISGGLTYQRGKKHGKLITPEGKRIAIPSTPSDKRAFYNFRSDIRKIQ